MISTQLFRQVSTIASLEEMNEGAFCVFERLLSAESVEFGDLSINQVCGLVCLASDIYNDIYKGLGR